MWWGADLEGAWGDMRWSRVCWEGHDSIKVNKAPNGDSCALKSALYAAKIRYTLFQVHWEKVTATFGYLSWCWFNINCVTKAMSCVQWYCEHLLFSGLMITTSSRHRQQKPLLEMFWMHVCQQQHPDHTQAALTSSIPCLSWLAHQSLYHKTAEMVFTTTRTKVDMWWQTRKALGVDIIGRHGRCDVNVFSSLMRNCYCLLVNNTGCTSFEQKLSLFNPKRFWSCEWWNANHERPPRPNSTNLPIPGGGSASQVAVSSPSSSSDTLSWASACIAQEQTASVTGEPEEGLHGCYFLQHLVLYICCNLMFNARHVTSDYFCLDTCLRYKLIVVLDHCRINRFSAQPAMPYITCYAEQNWPKIHWQTDREEQRWPNVLEETESKHYFLAQ